MTKKDKLFKVLPYLLIISVFVVNLGMYFTHKINMNIFFGSDPLYLPALYKDLIINSGSYASWYLTPAPYFFPDMILYFLSNYITTNYYYAIPMFFSLYSLLTIFIFYKIFSLFFSKHLSLVLISIIFSFLYIFPTSVSHFQFNSAYHYGEFIFGLFILYIILLILDQKKPKFIYLFTLFFLASLIIASDNLFLVHYLIPLLLSIFVLWGAKKLGTIKLLIISGTLVSSLWFGRIIHNMLIIHKTGYKTKLSIENLSTNVNILVNIFQSEYQNNTISFITGISISILALFILLFRKKLLCINKDSIISKKILFVSMFMIFMIFGTIMVLSLVGIVAINRYMIPLFLLPIWLSPIYILCFSPFKNKNIENNITSTIVFILFVTVLVDANQKFKHSTFRAEYYSHFIECIDNFVEETNSKLGIANYWQSKQIYMLSKNEIVVAQVLSNLEPKFWINSDQWYADRYDFALIDNGAAILDKLDKRKITSINGNPDKIYICENTEILYYKNKMSTKLFTYPDSSRTWEASKLPSNVGEKKDTSIMIKQGAKKGIITFGPYAVLPAGKYKFDYSYISPETNNTIIGNWDVGVTLSKDSKQINKGVLLGTNNQNGHIIQEFTILKEYSNQKIEIRNYYNGIGDLTIRSLTITRIQ